MPDYSWFFCYVNFEPTAPDSIPAGLLQARDVHFVKFAKRLYGYC